MIRIIIAAAALASSASLALAATDDELREQILGPWGQDAACADGALTFAADGTYALVRPGDDTESGTWAIADGILTGEGQPASKVTIEGDSLSLGDPKGNGRVETFNRCPA